MYGLILLFSPPLIYSDVKTTSGLMSEIGVAHVCTRTELLARLGSVPLRLEAVLLLVSSRLAVISNVGGPTVAVIPRRLMAGPEENYGVEIELPKRSWPNL
jgi:hypothetical protein